MNMKKVETSMEEANRFLKRCRDLINRDLEEKKHKDLHGFRLNPFTGCKESGAVKRSSLDLSNALADLRKSQ